MNTTKTDKATVEDQITVLLIDDDEEDFIITEDLIQNIKGKQFLLHWEQDHEKGLEKTIQEDYDVYLIDYHLGGTTTGLDLIKQAMTKGVKKPIILLTGQGDIEIDRKAMALGAVDYLIKGELDERILERSIRYSVNHAKTLQEIIDLNADLEKRVEQRTKELSYTVSRLEQLNQELEKEIEERKLTENALKESQALYTAIAQNFPSGTINVIDRNFRYVFLEGKELTRLGENAEDFIGKTVREILPSPQAEKFEEQLEAVFEGANKTSEIHIGDNYYVFNSAPLPANESESIDRVLTVVENITLRKKIELDMIHALEKEKELNELKSRFVSMASHEFRTPLSTVLSSISLIARYRKEEDQPKRDKHIERVRSSVQNLTDILDDLLNISKLEEGKIQNKPELVSVPEFFQSLAEEMEQEEQGNIRIHYENDEALKEVEVDKRMLKNITLNLLSNAIKYSPEDQPVEMKTVKKGKKMVLSVIDHGIGIPEEDQKNLFSRFFRASNVTNIQGTGLGLNIVKKYLDLMNGDIEVESIIDEGTIIKAYLPLSNPEKKKQDEVGTNE